MSSFKFPVQRYLETFWRISLLLVLYIFCRILFFLFNKTVFVEADFTSLLLAFIHGIRFDLSIIFSSNSLFIIMSLLPIAWFDSKRGQLLLKSVFLVVNIPLLLMNMADIQYYKFTAKRTGYDILGVFDDIRGQSIQLIFHYWYIILLVAFFGWILYRLYNILSFSVGGLITIKYSWILILLIIPFSIIVIRGGFQHKPLKPDHAFIHSPNVLGNLVLNTPFNFFTTLSFPSVKKISFFKTDSEAIRILIEDKKTMDTVANRENVVVIILESFSREYMGIGHERGYTPFLDSLSREAVFFDKHFANGRRSIEAVPSIYASIPALMEEAFITGVYQSNEIKGLPDLLNKEGYHTAFFHGGINGTMGFDKFTTHAGFKEYYGMDEFSDSKNNFDGNWGIYDEPYLRYFCNTISDFRPPFFASVFTLSSHQPYSIPKEFKGKFPKGTLPIHESIGYADFSLKKFFEQAKKQPWFKNTLFIITADHTQELESEQYRNAIGRYRVPLIVFHPNKTLKLDTSQVTQHIDIMPTVLDYIGIVPYKPILIGRSLFDNGVGSAIFLEDRNYYYVNKNYIMSFNENRSSLYFYADWHQKELLLNQNEDMTKMEAELKAIIQYYNNGLIKNNWYRYSN